MVDQAVLDTISGIDADEMQEWYDSLDDILHRYGSKKLGELLIQLQERAYEHGVKLPFSANTPYINTIHHSEQPLQRCLACLYRHISHLAPRL